MCLQRCSSKRSFGAASVGCRALQGIDRWMADGNCSCAEKWEMDADLALCFSQHVVKQQPQQTTNERQRSTNEHRTKARKRTHETINKRPNDRTTEQTDEQTDERTHDERRTTDNGGGCAACCRLPDAMGACSLVMLSRQVRGQCMGLAAYRT